MVLDAIISPEIITVPCKFELKCGNGVSLFFLISQVDGVFISSSLLIRFIFRAKPLTRCKHVGHYHCNYWNILKTVDKNNIRLQNIIKQTKITKRQPKLCFCLFPINDKFNEVQVGHTAQPN